MKIKEILKKLKFKILKIIENEREKYTNDCLGNIVKREQLSEEEIKELLEKKKRLLVKKQNKVLARFNLVGTFFMRIFRRWLQWEC